MFTLKRSDAGGWLAGSARASWKAYLTIIHLGCPKDKSTLGTVLKHIMTDPSIISTASGGKHAEVTSSVEKPFLSGLHHIWAEVFICVSTEVGRSGIGNLGTVYWDFAIDCFPEENLQASKKSVSNKDEMASGFTKYTSSGHPDNIELHVSHSCDVGDHAGVDCKAAGGSPLSRPGSSQREVANGGLVCMSSSSQWGIQTGNLSQ